MSRNEGTAVANVKSKVHLPSAALKAALACALGLAVAACGGGGSSSDGGGGGGGPTTPPPSDCSAGTSFDSTYAGIQSQIFEKHGCTNNLCHGSAKQGGLQLDRKSVV